MNQTQKNYMTAKANYDAAIIAYCADMAQYDEPETDADFDAYEINSAEVSERYNVDALRETLNSAEEAMLKWAQSKVSKHPAFTSEHAEAFKIVNASIIARRKLIDLAFRLS